MTDTSEHAVRPAADGARFRCTRGAPDAAGHTSLLLPPEVLEVLGVTAGERVSLRDQEGDHLRLWSEARTPPATGPAITDTVAVRDDGAVRFLKPWPALDHVILEKRGDGFIVLDPKAVSADRQDRGPALFALEAADMGPAAPLFMLGDAPPAAVQPAPETTPEPPDPRAALLCEDGSLTLPEAVRAALPLERLRFARRSGEPWRIVAWSALPVLSARGTIRVPSLEVVHGRLASAATPAAGEGRPSYPAVDESVIFLSVRSELGVNVGEYVYFIADDLPGFRLVSAASMAAGGGEEPAEGAVRTEAPDRSIDVCAAAVGAEDVGAADDHGDPLLDRLRAASDADRRASNAHVDLILQGPGAEDAWQVAVEGQRVAWKAVEGAQRAATPSRALRDAARPHGHLEHGVLSPPSAESERSDVRSYALGKAARHAREQRSENPFEAGARLPGEVLDARRAWDAGWVWEDRAGGPPLRTRTPSGSGQKSAPIGLPLPEGLRWFVTAVSFVTAWWCDEVAERYRHDAARASAKGERRSDRALTASARWLAGGAVFARTARNPTGAEYARALVDHLPLFRKGR
jgi:hypothetical protein